MNNVEKEVNHIFLQFVKIMTDVFLIYVLSRREDLTCRLNSLQMPRYNAMVSIQTSLWNLEQYSPFSYQHINFLGQYPFDLMVEKSK